MNFGTKVDLSVVLVVLLQHLVTADNEFFNKCPEFNPQNELDIELVRKSPCEIKFFTSFNGSHGCKFHPRKPHYEISQFLRREIIPPCAAITLAPTILVVPIAARRRLSNASSLLILADLLDFRPLVRHRDDNALRGPWRLRSGLRFLRHRAN